MYDELYADSVYRQMIGVFSRVPFYLKDINIEWWIDKYMTSDWRKK